MFTNAIGGSVSRLPRYLSGGGGDGKRQFAIRPPAVVLTLVYSHEEAPLGVVAHVLVHEPFAAGLEAFVQLLDVVRRVGDAAEAEHGDDAVHAAGCDLARSEQRLDAHRHDLVDVLQTRVADLLAQQAVHARVGLDPVDARDAGATGPGGGAALAHRVLLLGGAPARQVLVGEQVHPHAAARSDLDHGAADAGVDNVVDYLGAVYAALQEGDDLALGLGPHFGARDGPEVAEPGGLETAGREERGELAGTEEALDRAGEEG